ncbi:hypothetical protein F7725_026838 [Dissostichus mawsoni]|uniref:Cadherin domain-containing protein n=1 Tax=Dissostichus mawsoni TaxID=36200 RepID=A0A7J5X8L2_DISMA|nr:hypothetical protein F7725_026838 [Dissostichus mawsoni]
MLKQRSEENKSVLMSASDCDSEENAELTYYTLIRSDGDDKGEVPRTGTTTVRIRMANVNDEAPEFSQHIYRTFVSEDAGPNTLVATVLAKDPDGDGITYKINTGNEEGNLSSTARKGVEYVLNVTATDDNSSGGPQALSSTAQVIVGVDDVNNNKPVFEKLRHPTKVGDSSVVGSQ